MEFFLTSYKILAVKHVKKRENIYEQLLIFYPVRLYIVVYRS